VTNRVSRFNGGYVLMCTRHEVSDEDGLSHVDSRVLSVGVSPEGPMLV